MSAWCLTWVLGLSACAPLERQPDSFVSWHRVNAAPVAALEAHLREQGVADVLPLHQLLRSASSWQACLAEPYALPPPGQWPSVVSVLRLLRELRLAGSIGPIEVHSGYRDAALNACAGGAGRSAHLLAFAIDFTPADGRDPTAAICAYWRQHGRDWHMGFGRYASGRIHIDTMGYRTWGSDHSGRTSVCSAS